MWQGTCHPAARHGVCRGNGYGTDEEMRVNAADCLALLLKEPLPLVEQDPTRVAMLQTMQRIGHIRAHSELRDGRTRIIVEAVTPLVSDQPSHLDSKPRT